YHPDWGVGLVKRLDLFSERVTFDFERKKNHEITVNLAQEILEPLRHRDIRAAWVREPDRVNRLVEEDSAELVRMALISCGRKASAGELKQRLCGSIIPEKKWSRWWTNASAAVKKDPFISLAGSASKAYILRKEPRSTEEEWMESFEKKRNPIEKIDLVLSYLRNTKPSNYDVELLRRFSLMLAALAKERRNPAVRLEIYLTLEDLNRREPSIDRPAESTWDEILTSPSEAVDLLLQLAYPDHQWRMWERLRERYPDAWSEICGTLMLSHQSLIRDRLAEWLRSEHHEAILSDLAKRVAPDPREYPEAFAWFSDEILLGNRQDVSMGIDPPVLFERLLMLVDFLNDRAKRVEKTEAEMLRASAAQVRSVLKKDDFAILDKILPNIDRSVAQSLYKRANGNGGLDIRAREKITRRILARFPGLLGSLETGSEGDRPTEFLCTYPAHEARRKRLQQIIEQELPRVTDQIEEARKHGDLSENAEYHAAKDKQKTLYGEAADLRDQLQMARPTDLSRVVPDEVKFGVKVRIANAEGEAKVYTVLGPWESIPEQDILSYQAPFMRSFLGKKTGDIVEIDLPNRKGTFTVGEIESVPAELYPLPN
nr:GreA/GreB family elongation factor [bacterium]